MSVRTVCSGCGRATVVDADRGIVKVRVESNGRRGSLHVPAHDAAGDLLVDDMLVMWDCPACGYADSVEHGEISLRGLDTGSRKV